MMIDNHLNTQKVINTINSIQTIPCVKVNE